jgi:hypothetical protein
LEINLDEGPAVRLFSFEKLIPAIAASALAVVQLIECIAKDLRCAPAGRIELEYCPDNGGQLRVI